MCNVGLLKPRPHQKRLSNVERFKSKDSFDKVERCFGIVAGVDGALSDVLIPVHSVEAWARLPSVDHHTTPPDLQIWGPVEYKCKAGALAITSFLFRFPLFRDAFQRVSC